MSTFDGFMNFTVGILNGSSLTTENGQLIICRDTIQTSWFYGYQTLANHGMSANYFGVIYEVFDMMTSIDPIARSCFGGMESSVWQYYNWT